MLANLSHRIPETLHRSLTKRQLIQINPSQLNTLVYCSSSSDKRINDIRRLIGHRFDVQFIDKSAFEQDLIKSTALIIILSKRNSEISPLTLDIQRNIRKFVNAGGYCWSTQEIVNESIDDVENVADRQGTLVVRSSIINENPIHQISILAKDLTTMGFRVYPIDILTSELNSQNLICNEAERNWILVGEENHLKLFEKALLLEYPQKSIRNSMKPFEEDVYCVGLNPSLVFTRNLTQMSASQNVIRVHDFQNVNEDHDFNFNLYRKHLQNHGRLLLHTSITSSTQTFLVSNPNFTNILPHGFVFHSNEQTAGKGRGKNGWISSLGCLQFSLLIRCEMNADTVFIQYLMAMAIVKVLREKISDKFIMPVFIKWPNDIYVDINPPISNLLKRENYSDDPLYDQTLLRSKLNNGDFVKIGGILVNACSSRKENEMELIIGSGINLNNNYPTTSISSILSSLNNQIDSSSSDSVIQQEKVLANILNTFDEMFHRFRQFGFSIFRSDYYRLWLHQDQIVRIDGDKVSLSPYSSKVPKHTTFCKIIGLSNEGYLLCIACDYDGNCYGHQIFKLLPGSNSFIMSEGLLISKV